ncbi:biotin--[acetyl-CoA-carboxylase] ligase [Paramaledivibacter caminithermalis]|uniref:Bifunctional ligase/repressor BirA n=1 Tax=Paramaledivibacter caminithermalis (strain DSM 15212 / CIP 107654 / DViRD3) TaxID=1121301 RepID=A0A1M6N150_PARC5|nr:biotin--[acetyl-CoA-carboxylase] ligase [Paramaledivibacter caminithermalis]SHJ89378.1 BirA family transcriptional regulator, biotin operon repressor / biotin-[acetyl-CoA-carboxylase] ligase [Paramaledivibacter caminithermalis DSM 15212]
MKKKILEVLKKNKNNFISGEQLSNQLGVTRTSIWKHVNALKEEGYEIESISRKGYKLIKEPDILSRDELLIELESDRLGNDIHCFKTIDSTNNYAKKLALDGALEGTIVISEEQTGGRGRLGRHWVSPAGDNIYMSMILRPTIYPNEAAKITIIAAASIANSINKVTGLEAGIKWPNDIIIDNKKVCGILTEMSAELNNINYVILGMGVNVNIDKFPKEIDHIATSLKKALGTEVSRKEILINIVKEFEELYYNFINTGSLKKTVDICKKKSVTLGKIVNIINKNEIMIAEAIDITENGELVIRKDNGEIINIISGEVSVRGIDSYV